MRGTGIGVVTNKSRGLAIATLLTAINLLAPFTPLSQKPSLAQDPNTLRQYYQQTVDTYDQALTEARRSGVRAQEVDVRVNAGVAYRYLGQDQKSVTVLQQALAIAREIQDAGREANALRELASTYSKLGDYLGIDFYEQQWQMAQKGGSLATRAAILQNLGMAYLQIGNFKKGVVVYEQYLPLLRQLNDPFQLDIAQAMLGGMYRALGETQKAQALLEERLATARRIGNAETELNILLELAQTQQMEGKITAAIATYDQALQKARQIKAPQRQIQVLQAMAQMYATQNQPQKTIELLQAALAVAQTGKDTFNQATILDDLSRAHSLVSDYPKAIELQQQSLQLYRQLRDDPRNYGFLEGQALSALGYLQFRANQLAEAEKTLRTALQVNQHFREQVLGNSGIFAQSRDDLNLNLREQSADIYRILQQILIARNQPEAALEVAEEGRARAFVDLLAIRFDRNSKLPTQVTAPKLAQLRQIAKAQNATLVEYSILYNDLYFAQYRLGQPLLETDLFIWVIKPTGEVAFRQVPLKSGLGQLPTLETLVILTRDALGTGNRGFNFNENVAALQRYTSTITAQVKQQELQQLYQLLIEPIADLLPTRPSDRVTFIPQGALFMVPFAALQDATGTYLLKKHTILTAPSIQMLALTHQQRHPDRASAGQRGREALVVGNPVMPKIQLKVGGPRQQLASLPGAEQEAKAIAKLLNTKALTGQAATEAAIVQQMPQARVIHLATHGLLDTLVGFESAVALAPASQAENLPTQQDGFLTAREILKLNLKADLVVLSACDTGRGRISGDGVIGLSRSLISAGTPSVIVSLWKVPDAPTATLMTEFYKNWQKQPDKAQALRQAMLTTAKNYPNPKDWAAFVLIGEAE